MKPTTLLAIGIAALGAAQVPVELRLEAQLRELFPNAGSFSPKIGTPPHFEAYSPEGTRTLVGIAVWTTDLDPLERGYDGPIKMLVGLDMRGVLAGVIVADHHEPYGYFSVDRPEFAAQFKGKGLREAFKVGGDVQAVSRATLTTASAARAIRNSARRAAAALVPRPTSASPVRPR